MTTTQYAWPNPTDGMPVPVIMLVRAIGRMAACRRELHRIYGPCRGSVEFWTADRSTEIKRLAAEARRMLGVVRQDRRMQILAALAQEVVRATRAASR